MGKKKTDQKKNSSSFGKVNFGKNFGGKPQSAKGTAVQHRSISHGNHWLEIIFRNIFQISAYNRRCTLWISGLSESKKTIYPKSCLAALTDIRKSLVSFAQRAGNGWSKKPSLPRTGAKMRKNNWFGASRTPYKPGESYTAQLTVIGWSVFSP